MNEFMLISLMSLEEVQREAKTIIKNYPKTKNMPLNYLVRMNVLISDIKRREQIDLLSKTKKQNEILQKKLEKTAKEDFEKYYSFEMLSQRIKLIRERLLMTDSGSETTETKNKM